MECTMSSSFDDEIKLLDIKHKEQMDNMQSVMDDLQKKYIEERTKLIETKVRSEFEADSHDYMNDFIDVALASKYIRRSQGWLYRSIYDVENEQPTATKCVPAHKRGTRYYFTRRELQDWVLGGRKNAVNEIEKKAQEYLATH